MQICVLGPFEVWIGGRRVEAGPPQRRAVLAVLVSEAGRLVTAETLIYRVWGEAPPAGARRALHAHITRIRGLLHQVGAAPPPGQDGATVCEELDGAIRPTPSVVRRSGGYVLEVNPDQVDLHRFRRLVALASDPGCDVRTRTALLGHALSLWRGEPLAGLRSDWAVRTAEAWQSQQLDVFLAWVDALIAVGDPTAVLGPVGELAWQHPLDERLAAAQMRTLHVVGRTAAALEVYTGIRTRLIEELGIDPGSELQNLQQAILHGESGLPNAISSSLINSSPIRSGARRSPRLPIEMAALP